MPTRTKEVIYQEPVRFFMTYFEHPRLTITIVAGDSFARLRPRDPREVFIVRDAWYPADPAAEIARQRQRGPSPASVHYLSNTEELHEIRRAHGFQSHHVNIGCFVDESIFAPAEPPVAKEFDAVMNARFTSSTTGSELKRHHLTGKIRRLALLDPVIQSHDLEARNRYVRRENCKLWNARRLPPHLLVEVLRRSHAGLILSELEGVSRASSEYLLTGIPVVSTRSVGGRDAWYDDYNSIIVEPDEGAVADAVDAILASPRDPQRIRAAYLARATVFRERFRNEVLAPILADHGVDLTAGEVMSRHPFRWWPSQPRVFPPPTTGLPPRRVMFSGVVSTLGALRATARRRGAPLWRVVDRWLRMPAIHRTWRRLGWRKP